jgi:guanylate kinase
MRGQLFVVSSPSGGGKTSLIQAALASLSSVQVSISYTTRPPRPGEQDGVHYHYITESAFEAKIAAGDMLEYACVFDRWYGTCAKTIQTLLSQGIDVVLDIDWQGARQIRARFLEQQVSIFILPPSLDTLYQRLRVRGQDSEERIAYRMGLAHSEMSHYAEYDYMLVNQEFEIAADQLRSIILSERLRLRRQTLALKDTLNALQLPPVDTHGGR